ncbi:MAG: endonuclease/exonuclease/phosphatase family protein [Oscillospiraceae bacterium]|nr:endonuclease/exonuclease/phosphatase family protein [Oscillospiraceae bacterium]
MKKNVTRLISIILCAALLFAWAYTAAIAQKASEENTLKLISYNVSGLPIEGKKQGSAGSSGKKKARVVGEYLNALELDIIGVQEDFNFHKHIAAKMCDYPYKTVHSGGVPAGDGLNIFSRRGIFNVERVGWNEASGVLSGSNDRLAPKGFIYAVMEIADGVYIDYYLLHADAGRDEGSIEARADNYRQLASHVNAREHDRALIMLGDFNGSFSRAIGDDLYGNLVAVVGLTDVWAELHNGGNHEYGDGSDWNPTYEEKIDRIMYKNGGGIEFTPLSFEYTIFVDEDGHTHTDHMAALSTLSYTIKDPPDNTQELKTEEPIGRFKMFAKQTRAVGRDLWLILTNLKELFD